MRVNGAPAFEKRYPRREGGYSIDENARGIVAGEMVGDTFGLFWTTTIEWASI